MVTGHTRNGDLEDWQALANLQGTLVFLMGLGQLSPICENLLQYGKAPETPVSILCGGYSAEELRLDGTLSTMVEKARGKAFAPAIIVVGPAAAMHLEGKPKDPVMVTGSRSFCHQVAMALEPLGWSVKQVPVLEIEPCTDRLPTSILEASWLVFTSRNGVRLFGRWLRQHSLDHRKLAGCLAGVPWGRNWGRVVPAGFTADLMPETYTAEALGKALARTVAPGNGACIAGRGRLPGFAPGSWKKPESSMKISPFIGSGPSGRMAIEKPKLAPRTLIFGSAKGGPFLFCPLYAGLRDKGPGVSGLLQRRPSGKKALLNRPVPRSIRWQDWCRRYRNHELFSLMIQLGMRRCCWWAVAGRPERKAAILKEFGAAVEVVAPAMDPEIRGLDVILHQRPFALCDLERQPWRLVVAATDDRAVNRVISEGCRKQGIPVNVVDDPELCTFIFPAIVKQQELVCAVSSGGRSPLVAQWVKGGLQQVLPEDLGTLNEAMGQFRKALQREEPEAAKQRDRLKKKLAELLGKGL